MADKRVLFSKEELPIGEIVAYFATTEKALRLFYLRNNPHFIGYTFEELENERDQMIDELDKSTAFTILATLEAHLRVDFLQRCYNRKRDPLSRKFRDLNKEKGSKVLLDDILELWMQHITRKSVISELRGAINYRHWLAHGRYWVVRLGQKYDFHSVLTLAKNIQTELGIQMGA